MEDAATLQNEIRKETLDLYNRLHSIDEDIANVNHIRSAYPRFPIIR
jgi:tRNA A64-2'-O-ribosylphosphate transferase